jgi:hypothetical protein
MFAQCGHHQVLQVVGEETAVLLCWCLVVDVWFSQCACVYSFLLCSHCLVMVLPVRMCVFLLAVFSLSCDGSPSAHVCIPTCCVLLVLWWFSQCACVYPILLRSPCLVTVSQCACVYSFLLCSPCLVMVSQCASVYSYLLCSPCLVMVLLVRMCVFLIAVFSLSWDVAPSAQVNIPSWLVRKQQ